VGIVSKVFPDRGYGFLRKEDGEVIYFHRNSVLNDEFDEAAVGTAARFVAEMGEKGLQATTVQLIGKPGRPDTSLSGDPPGE
jgi:cold shock CspA family protein